MAMMQTSLTSVFLLIASCQTPLETGSMLELNSPPTVSSFFHALPSIGRAVGILGPAPPQTDPSQC